MECLEDKDGERTVYRRALDGLFDAAVLTGAGLLAAFVMALACIAAWTAAR